MRARLPDREGVVQRDGVRVAFEVFGHGEPALLLIPASPITHARSWKGIVPSLARRPGNSAWKPTLLIHSAVFWPLPAGIVNNTMINNSESR